MSKNYNFRSNEKKWVKKEENIFKKKAGDSYYLLSMFPYPSGRFHCGHIRNYTITDVLSRYKHLLGYKVFSFFGWDAFGLPAENAARENNTHPKTWTLKNIANMKEDILKMGYLLDWDHEISTCSNKYIAQQQEIFLALWKAGYIYKKKEWVNWDPVEKSVLANEQVCNGKGWRSGASIERKKIEQWFIKISEFKNILLDDLKKLQNWPEKIVTMQRNWIGQSHGVIIKFPTKSGKILEVFTTCPEVIFGCQFLTVSQEHEDDILDEIAINPYTKEEIKIYKSEYVLSAYGTGIVMAVPSCDKRDREFAEKNLSINYIDVVDQDNKMINSSFLNGLTREEARNLITKELTKKTFFTLRDWCLSRQRYWGCPIPIIYCNKCGILPAKLPVLLPENVEFKEGNPLDNQEEWKNVICHQCGENAKRETDTMDTFVDSSWYFLRFPCAKSDQIFDQNIEKLPVDTYVGGAEHAVLHLLYARFMTKVLNKINYIPPINEPFKQLITQGMVCMETYKGKESNRYYYPEEIIERDGKYFTKTEEVIVGPSVKMSKSLKNTISPIEMIDIYGLDALRLFIISDTPVDKDFDWNTNALFGCNKWMNLIWKTFEECKEKELEPSEEFKNEVNQLLFEITESLEKIKLNIYVSKLRELFRLIQENPYKKYGLKKFLVALWPIGPFIAYECYYELFGEYIFNQIWDKGKPASMSFRKKILIQVNGKKKKEIVVSQGDDIETIAMKEASIEKYKKIIHVENKLINFVI